MDDTIPPIPPADDEDHDGGLLDRLRDMPVGTLDPNIIGDAGPTDIPPGSDPPEIETGAVMDASDPSEP